jgi:hypothetical protein
MVINPEEVGYSGAELIDTTKTMATGIYEYLIICTDSVASGFDSLATWKTKKGYRTKVAKLGEIFNEYSGKDDMDKIRNCIIDYFKNHGCIYVLVAGKGYVLETRKCYLPGMDPTLVPTEMYYADLDGTWDDNNNSQYGEPGDGQDYYYDVLLGRLPITSENTIAPLADKILIYEGANAGSTQNPWDYSNKMLFMAGYLDAQTDASTTKDYIDNTYVPDWWNIKKLYQRDGNFTKQNCLDEMNAGKNVLNHVMHANAGLLGTQDGGMTAGDLENLTNKPRFISSFYTVGCYAGDTDVPANCSFCFVNANNGGGITMTANTRNGWYSPGSYRMFSNDFDIEYFNQLCTNDVWIAGETTAKHKYAYASTANTNVYYRYIYYELYLCGDPDAPILTGDPKSMTVDCKTSVPRGGIYYKVNVSDSGGKLKDALVCVWKGDEIYAKGKTDSNGDIQFHVGAQTPGTMLLTITAHNHEPIEKDIEVRSDWSSVELISFDAVKTDTYVKLNWSVDANEPIRGFNLYRTTAQEKDITASELTSSPDAIWTKVNKDLITGNNPYSYTDRTTDKNANYVYKLEAITYDKVEVLGETKTEGNQSPSSFALTNVYPNPANTNVNMTIAIPVNASVDIAIYDISGRKVSTVASGLYSPGEYTLTSDVTGLTNGVYIVKMTTDGFNASKNFVVAK